MSLQYVDETDVSLNRGTVGTGEVVHEGDFVVQNASGDYALFDPANDALPHGIVVHNAGRLSDALVEHDEDYVDYERLRRYEAGEDFYLAPLRQVDQVIPRILSDEAQPEPALDEGTVAVVVRLNSDIDGNDYTEVVEDGYSPDGGTTVYTESNGNAVELGRVDKDLTILSKIDDLYGRRIPVRMDADVFQP